MNVRSKVPSSTEQMVETVAKVAPLNPIEVYSPAPKLYPPKIAKAILAITRELGPVKKAGVNDFHKYSYPRWEDVLDALGPLIAQNGLIITQGEISHGGFERDLIEISYEFAIINEDGDVWPDRIPITAICKVRDAKGTIDDKAASKCHTQAQKYAMMQLFKIRVRDMEQDDIDYDPRIHKLAKKRPVPNTSGKLAPHAIATIEGDTAATWATRFIAAIDKAENEAEVEAWDKANDELLTKLADKAPDTFNKAVDAISAKVATFHKSAPKKADPISSGPRPPADDLEIPAALRRQPAAPDWQGKLASADGQAGRCKDADDLNDLWDVRISPMFDGAPKPIAEEAMGIYQKHFKKFED